MNDNSYYLALNNMVGLEPFKTNALEKTDNKTGFTIAKQKVELIPLEVLCGSGSTVPTGAIAYVDGDASVTADAKRVFEIDGRKVIFLPITSIRAIKIPQASPAAVGV